MDITLEYLGGISDAYKWNELDWKDISSASIKTGDLKLENYNTTSEAYYFIKDVPAKGYTPQNAKDILIVERDREDLTDHILSYSGVCGT